MNETTDPNNYKSILIIEDNFEIRESLKIALEMEGFSVFLAENGKIGLEKLAVIPTPCVILLDLMMPVMNGWEFIEIISKDIMLSTIPIIVVSAFGEKNTNPKPSAYIQKPIDLDALLSAVSKHCG